MPVDALKKTTGAPEGTGSRRATCRATLATLRLFSLRTSPRLMRWVKYSLKFIVYYRGDVPSPGPVTPPLPIVVFFIAKRYEQIPGYIFE